MLPVLKERAARTEELRRIPTETVEELLSAGLCRIGVPRRFSGLDVDYRVILDVSAELGRGCPSTAWCCSLWIAHAWLVGYWPQRAQEEVFGQDPDALCSSSLNTGKSSVMPVEGGYRLSADSQAVLRTYYYDIPEDRLLTSVTYEKDLGGLTPSDSIHPATRK